ncbi:MAG TPA: hypothetical protein VME21_02475 [Steroidobacteraceae bacterium]|nr:hypothetical protein [Steroidobacteraceae bacterium]
MDHLRFQSNQTAAAYVAQDLDHQTQEAFELHMMACADCVQEVEMWRTVQDTLGTEARTSAPEDDTVETLAPPIARSHRPVTAARRSRTPESSAVAAPRKGSRSSERAGRWRLAAVLVGVGLASGAGGWYARTAQGPWAEADRISFYSLPAVTRGASDCTVVRLDARANLLAIRVPGLLPGQQLVAVDSEGRDLGAAEYAARAQVDGSWFVRLRASTVREQGIRFEARSPDGDAEPRGCIVSGSAE